MAVIRKISGGSQSNQGAAIHAVLMSVAQTISLKTKYQGHHPCSWPCQAMATRWLWKKVNSY